MNRAQDIKYLAEAKIFARLLGLRHEFIKLRRELQTGATGGVGKDEYRIMLEGLIRDMRTTKYIYNLILKDNDIKS